MDSKFTIDLNQPPPIIDDELHNEEEEIPIFVTSSISGNFLPELTNDNHEIGSRIIELDLQDFREDDDGASSDSLEEEIVGQQTWDNYAMTTTNSEISRTVDGPEISQGNVRGKKKKVLTNVERWAVYHALLEKSVNGKLKKNVTKEVQEMFNIESLRTVQRIWKIHKRTPPGTDVDISSRKTKICGRKRIEVNLSRVQEIELHQRTTLTSLSDALGVSYSKLHRLFQQGVIRRHSSAIKPHLKEENKTSRLEFCLSMLDESTMLNDPKFKGMYNYVHIDEKWFYMTKKDQTYYLLDNEGDPDRSCQSKNFIVKVMFLAPTARPRFDDEGMVVFSGKIGCWPFVTEQPAQRSSRNRQAGTMEIKAITSVKRETIKAFLIEKVIPAIHEKWPISDRGKTIFIQQDNARTHVPPNDPDFLAATSRSGFDIQLTCQPPNSPDFNILDLGFFRAIQSLQQKMRARTITELVHAVEKSFYDYSPVKLNYVWLTLQLCMKEAMKLGGGNRYKIPHINKERLQRLGCLPTQIQCETTLVQATRTLVATRLDLWELICELCF